MATNQKNAENTNRNPRNVENKTKIVEILSEAWNLGLFPSILVGIVKKMGIFVVSLSLISTLAVSPFKMALCRLLRLRFQLSAQSALCFYTAMRRNLAAARKHDLYSFSIKSVAATTRDFTVARAFATTSTYCPGSNS